MGDNYPFIPIIVGTDINAYTMTISFHEEYGIRPILVGKAPLPFTKLSTIPKVIEYFDEISDPEKFASVLIKVADKYKEPNKKLLLIGTNDLYVRLIIENAEILREHFVFNYISEEIMNKLQIKSNFYKLCEELGVDTPTTYFYSCESQSDFDEEMVYPVIVKPSNGIMYNERKFAGQQKVYKVNTLEELNRVIHMIKESGYSDELIIQDYIPGDDTYMWDSVVYVSSRGEVQLVTFARVVLQEHTPTAIGNYTAVMTSYNEEMMKKLQGFLEHVGYTGFANFDIKYDERDGKYKLFEVNIRQGRSSYYTTQTGHNMARYFVDDLIYGKEKELTYLKEDYLFTVVPKIVLKKFVGNKEVQQEIRRLLRQRKFGNPLFYKKDKHFKRKLYMFARQVNYYFKYKNNNW
ncbi:carboxylate--amine ligase [Lysinibacillus sp. 54212]|uniref:carboxylate--amine ligase n=1 Tax=Lysinibacillus sp. 54212 TaxID=3119829 RepID=UPI002FCB5257